MEEQKYMLYVEQEEPFFTFIDPYIMTFVDERPFFVLIEELSNTD